MSIDKLTEQEWQTNEAIARRLNVVIEAVEALRRQFEQHIAAEVGAEPVLQDAEALVENMTDVARTWEEVARSRGRMLTRMCAERDAAQARVAELEALYQAGQDYANARCQERSELVAEIDKWKAKAKALEPDAALGALVRRMPPDGVLQRLRGNGWTAGPVLEGIWYGADTPEEALRAALDAAGEEPTP